MVDNTEDFFIAEDQVLEALSLEKTELDSIIDTLTKSEKFDFEEGVHFRYVNTLQKIRGYARLALTVLAEYYDSESKLNQSEKVVDLLKELVTKKEQKEIDNEITDKTIEVIHDSSNEILIKGNRHWLNYRDVKTILQTTVELLNQAFEDIARSDLPLIIGEDFEDIEVKNNYERHYSYSGLERICLELSQKLTSKYKRIYASRVPKIVPGVIEQTAQLRLPLDKDIERAKKEALKQQDNKCQVTGKTKPEVSLEVHHLYSQNTYPELASDQDNLFVISKEVHKEFHIERQRGTTKPCTVNDFIDFIRNTIKYGETHQVLTRLDLRKRSLEQKIKTRAKFKSLAPAPSSERETTITSSDSSVDRSLAKIQELQQIKDSEPLLILFWHRRDLRISDNIGLSKAWEKSYQIIGCFCLDPNILKADDIAPARVSYLLGCLAELSKSYQKLGSQLLILQGEPETKILELAETLKINSIFWNLDTEPHAQKRDQRVVQKLREKNIKVETFWDQLLHYPGSILSQSNTPYTVYTPFWKNWIQQPKADIVRTPNRLEGLSTEKTELVKKIGVIELPTLQELGFIWENQLLLNPGEKAAQERLDFFVETSLSNYQEQRNFPAIDGTSQLSAALKFGAIAIRTVWKKTIIALENSRSVEERDSIKTWQQELAWREFYQHCLFFFPDLAQGPYRDIFKQFRWDNNEIYFQAWCDGKTGYPMIDAAMRQLNETGWMHNRCRMIVASFLTKDLIINWQWGEKYFMQKLYDGDLAANNGGWQWSASSGMDAKPLRIFNPMTQAQKFDPEGEYIRQWLPELRSFDTKSILTGNISRLERLSVGYPEPIVDHHHQQQAFKQLYQAMKA